MCAAPYVDVAVVVSASWTVLVDQGGQDDEHRRAVRREAVGLFR
jgi:hypothetical protein